MRTGTSEPGALDARTRHAQEAYTRRRLAVYDAVVLGLFCSAVWRCPRRRMLRLYERAAGPRHLDVGPGTGYFLDRCRFPVERPEITLLDLSEECLEMSARRLARYAPATCRANLLEPLPLPSGHFDSVGLNLVLHTVPGGWDVKGAVFAEAARVLRPGGTLFGSTVLATGVPMNALTRRLLAEQHRRGNFQNQGDDPEGLRRRLRAVFPDARVVVRGSVALFRATV
ncbi:methyltransferase [Streptomyces mashuensis]|uniref:Methyltransferase n=1 Tax=Streptomyces mashuensis TaxID=33904 RepID=A0A919EFI3_9ACTN|nr:class I SAM-dependent methyltransferase [Streptomyces mashuensis]GHF65414.1 methyltransferase [Streptomyces mashuensis]